MKNNIKAIEAIVTSNGKPIHEFCIGENSPWEVHWPRPYICDLATCPPARRYYIQFMVTTLGNGDIGLEIDEFINSEMRISWIDSHAAKMTNLDLRDVHLTTAGECAITIDFDIELD